MPYYVAAAAGRDNQRLASVETRRDVRKTAQCHTKVVIQTARLADSTPQRERTDGQNGAIVTPGMSHGPDSPQPVQSGDCIPDARDSLNTPVGVS